jgi:chromosome segregation ATPase
MTADIPALTARVDSLQSRIRAALLGGNDTSKLRFELSGAERALAEAEHALAVDAEQVQDAADAKIQSAAAETTSAIHARLDAVMGDIAIPPETQPMDDDGQIAHAAAELARAEANLAQVNNVLADAQRDASNLAGRRIALEDRRAAIIERRANGDQRPGDPAEANLITLDIEGIERLQPDVAAPLAAATAVLKSATAARGRAAAALSAAEDSCLAQALQQRLTEIADVLATALALDDARMKRNRTYRPSWVLPADLLQKLQIRGASRPDLNRPVWRVAQIPLPERV